MGIDSWEVNLKRNEAASVIAEKLNSMKMLFAAEINQTPKGKHLYIKCDDLQLEYTDYTKNGMVLFLNQLKSLISDKSLVCDLLNDLNRI